MSPTRVVSDNVLVGTCPKETPSATKIKENSLIWAVAKPVCKLVFLRYPRAPIIAIKMSGFPMRMSRERMIPGRMSEDKSANTICEPSRMKNTMMKNFNFKNESGDKKYFTQIPNMIVNHSTAFEQSLYLIMKRLAGEGGHCFASLNFLAEKMGVDKKSVSKTITKLLARKWMLLVFLSVRVFRAG